MSSPEAKRNLKLQTRVQPLASQLRTVPTDSSLRGTYLGSCQNYGPFLGTLNYRYRIKILKQGPNKGP